MKRFLVLGFLLFSRMNLHAQNPLANLANSMQPGTWASLTTNNIDAVLHQGGVSGVRTHFSNTAAWDSTRLKLHFIGGDHNEPSMTYAIYDAAANAWTGVPVSYTGHGYDHTTVDSITGTIYHREYGLYPGGNKVFKYPVGGPWSQLPLMLPGYFQVAIGTAWWSGSLTGGGSNGTLAVYNGGTTNGQLQFYNPTTNAWFGEVLGFGGTSTYHGVIEYSAVCNCAVFGGGNLNPRKLWRLNANRTVTNLADAPLDFGIQRANVVADPVTGNFLFLGGGSFYEFDPTGSGTWTSKPLPPAAVGNPGGSAPEGVISSGISNYGVVMYVTCRSGGCSTYLYKHGSGGAPPPTNQPPMVNAGPDQSVQFPANAQLLGTSIDDGLPTTAVTYQWSGPSGVTFTNPSNLSTQASFSIAGTYILTLTANDGALTANDSLTVTVSSAAPPPVQKLIIPFDTIITGNDGKAYRLQGQVTEQ